MSRPSGVRSSLWGSERGQDAKASSPQGGSRTETLTAEPQTGCVGLPWGIPGHRQTKPHAALSPPEQDPLSQRSVHTPTSPWEQKAELSVACRVPTRPYEISHLR